MKMAIDTESSIRTAPAGRETDAAVTRALGRPIETRHRHYTADTPDGWAAMREEVAWLLARSEGFEVGFCGGEWVATVHFYNAVRRGTLDGSAPTMPLAVARLVLLVSLRESEQKEKAE